MGRGSSKAGGPGGGVTNAATEWYVSGEGMWINQYLRGNGDFGELSDSEKQAIKDLDKATSGTIKDDTLYRSVDASAIFGDMSDSTYSDLAQYVNYGENSFGKGAYADGVKSKMSNLINKTEGKTITEKGYMSTTTDSGVAEEWGDYTGSSKPVVMKIKTNSSTKGVDLSGYDKNVSAGEAQHERLLARNQSYQVTKIYSKNGYIYVDAEMKKKSTK